MALGLLAGPSGHAVERPGSSPPQKRVLVLHQLRRDSPVSVAMEDVYRRILGDALGLRLDYYSEYLDLYRFSEPHYRATLRAYLRDRYANPGLDVIVATTTAALDLVRHGTDDLFPGVPVVFHAGKGVSGGPHSTGVVSEVDIASSLSAALALQPGLKQVTVVAGSGEIDRSYRDLARAQFKAFEDRIAFEYLDGLPMARLEAAVSRLPSGSALFYVAISQDGADEKLVPVETLERLAAVANAPVYSWHEGTLGHGIVGGRLYSSISVAHHTARLALRVLLGERPEQIAVVQIDPYVTRFDARQLARWGLDESRLPAEASVLFRPRSVWDDYRPHVLSALGVIVVLAALCGTLLFEHRRRQRAEIEARRHLSTIADLDRRAAMGQLTASLAHEINQPLSAILRNAEAASMLLDAGAPSHELREIVDDIRSSDKRAAEIIRRMRTLMQKHEFAEEPVELNDLVRETMDVVATDASSRSVHVRLLLDKPAAVLVTGDRIHLQQVLLNLVLNGFDAMADTPEDERRLVVSTAAENGHVNMAVRDAGPGIHGDVMPRLFDPFFTTKRDGMGMGLSVVRSIVEAHNGHIEARNNAGRGATLRVSLPVRTHDMTGSA